MVLTSLAFVLAAVPDSADTPALVPGKPAPELVVGGWLKGNAPKTQKGRFRVVEFWATWCEPCRAAMPHLTELARKYRDRLDVVGVSVMEPPQITTDHLKRFVGQMGDKMEYRVAYDTPKGTMRTSWLTAAGLSTIPSTFLLDDAGKILWIGHPNQLERQLESAFAGKTDVDANRAALVSAVNWFEDSKAEIAKAEDAFKAGRKDDAEKTWNETLAKWPRATFMVRKSRLLTYPLGTPEHEAILGQMVTGNPVERETTITYARKLPASERERAVAIVDRAIEGAADYVLLYAAAYTYNQLEAYPKAIRAVDQGLVQVEQFLNDPQRVPLRPLNEENKAKFLKLREEAVTKSKSGS
jgi:thiol-disulfide isomerase/thioredoxin